MDGQNLAGRRHGAGRRAAAALGVALLAASPELAFASERIQLVGFVDRPCPGEAHCFEFDVKPDYREIAGASLQVRFADVAQIYDPENYALTLAQADLGPGAHLRLLLERDAAAGERAWRAIVIWIGD